MLHMLLHSKFESVGAIPASLPALLLFILSWIHSSPDKHMASPCTCKRNLLLHLGPFPLAPTGSSGSESVRHQTVCCSNTGSWGSLLQPPAAAAQATTQMLQPSSNPAQPSVGKMVCTRQREGMSFTSISTAARLQRRMGSKFGVM